jgi:hypothetical protein
VLSNVAFSMRLETGKISGEVESDYGNKEGD